ncbi:MAG: nucleotidyltransferase domain-containing protein [Legionella sp.]|nr:nucleotidyltransferase domain-containing protein [Legionella sp.]
MTNLSIEEDGVLRAIVEELTNKYDCHTIILYGSRARGDHTSTSDYDVAGISSSGKKQRIARFDSTNNVYHDIFIYAENDFSKLEDEHLNMADGKVIIEANDFGKNLLLKLKFISETPSSVSENEIHARKVWYKKMASRAAVGDLEGKYRHIWAIFEILEDYFIFRGRRYQGPKKAFQYLAQQDKKTLLLFDKVLKNTNDISALETLIERVTENCN